MNCGEDGEHAHEAHFANLHGLLSDLSLGR